MTYRTSKTPEEVNAQVKIWMSAGQPSYGSMSRNILTHVKTGYTEDFFVNDTSAVYKARILSGHKTAYELLMQSIKQEPITEYSPFSKL